MADYLHGAYGVIHAEGERAVDGAGSAFVYVGTAPVHQVHGGAENVNKPLLIHDMAEFKQKLGWSWSWGSYTLCEAAYAHFSLNGVGPLVMINVFDPATMKSSEEVSASLTPSNNRIVIAAAEAIILDTITITGKTLNTDYTSEYNSAKKQIVIQGITNLGTAALTVKYYTATPSSVSGVIAAGATDGLGTNTGVYCVQDVYQETGMIPAFLAAPGFSAQVEVHAAMIANSHKINGHWDAYMFVDLPLIASSTALTITTVATWKEANGYNQENETVYWPMAKGKNKQNYHLSVLAAANFQSLLAEQNDIPYRSASNTPAEQIAYLYLNGGAQANFSEQVVNEHLNKKGIASAAFVGGRWAIWGAHSAAYSETNADTVNVAETNRMMLYYVSNDFQSRRGFDVDLPLTLNDLESIASEEQARLDALIGIGALIYGTVTFNATAVSLTDVMSGDYVFEFNVTTTPLAKSLTAYVNWTDEGFVTWFASEGETLPVAVE